MGMNILLFGASGQVGWELRRSLAPLGEVVALSTASPGHAGDFHHLESVTAAVRDVAPQVIVNAAAYTAVDRAESEPGQAHALNAIAPGLLAREAERLGAWLVHYSTDYVFDGGGTTPWTEDDEPAPLNVYGRTKLEGEQLIRQHCSRHLILRTSWVYGMRGGNFIKTMLRLARERDELRVISDQIGAPTGAELIADVTAHALVRLAEAPELGGLYHLAAAGHISWHDYACHVIGHAPAALGPFKAGPAQVAAVPSSEYVTAACRPNNSRLDTGRFARAFGLRLPPWQDGVDRLLAELAAGA
jgi:dTDP-4-dehydrorhamnose reductase